MEVAVVDGCTLITGGSGTVNIKHTHTCGYLVKICENPSNQMYLHIK